jgi:hypothetical protein
LCGEKVIASSEVEGEGVGGVAVAKCGFVLRADGGILGERLRDESCTYGVTAGCVDSATGFGAVVVGPPCETGQLGAVIRLEVETRGGGRIDGVAVLLVSLRGFVAAVFDGAYSSDNSLRDLRPAPVRAPPRFDLARRSFELAGISGGDCQSVRVRK